MAMKRFYALGISILVMCTVAIPSWGQTVLLDENWDSGTIDGGKWSVNNPAGTVVQLEDLGGGDFAIYTQVDDELSQRLANFYSVDTFSRGNEIYCEFLAWYDPAASKKGWATGSNTPAIRAQVAGPWRQNNTGPNHYFDNQEACFSHFVQGQPNFGGGTSLYRIEEDGDYQAGARVALNYFNHILNASEKSKGLLHRVYLGDTQGARFQWSNDGGTTWYLEEDTRGTSGGTQAAGLLVGFGTNSRAVFIDDIRVVSGDGSPPIPIRPGTQAGVPLVDENWDSGIVDPTEWSVSLEFESLFEMEMEIGVQEFDPTGFPGNFAMSARGQNVSLRGSWHQTTFFHVLPFPRGQNVVCGFKFWRDAMDTGWGGTNCQSYHVGGPWHKDKSDLLFTPEAQIRYWIPWTPAGQGQEFATPGNPWTTSPKLTQGYHDAFCAATSREMCVTVEVLLGSTHGARIRWKSDGQFQTSFLTEYDTRGLPPDVGGNEPWNFSSPEAYVGFGTYSGRMFWDDISVVNDGSFGPASTPTIAPTPTETAVVAAVGNWENLE